MAINLLGASNARLEFGDLAAIAGLTGITVSITVNMSSLATGERVCGKWGPTAGTESFLLQITDNDELLFIVQNSSSYFGYKTTVTNLGTGTTYRIVCRWWATGNLDIWVNGVSQAITQTNAGSVSALPDDTSVVFVGHEAAETTDGPDGDYSEFAIHGTNMPDDYCRSYGRGYSPRLHPENGILYCRAVNTNSLIDEWGGRTVTNTAGTNAAHPAVIGAFRKLGGIFKIAAGGGTTTPVSLAATLSLTPAFIKEVGKITTATTVAIAGTVLSVGKTLAASVTLTPTLVVIRVTLVALAATLSLTPILIKQIGKNVAAGVTATPAFVRQMGLSLAATTISVAGSVMSVGKTLGTTVTLTAGLTLSLVATAIALAATVTLSAAMTLVTTVAPAVVRPFTGFAGLGWVGKTGWYARERRWRPRK